MLKKGDPISELRLFMQSQAKYHNNLVANQQYDAQSTGWIFVELSADQRER